ncbi:MAG: DUF3108 domain-containing protein [Steroidobacteraceae bacterium]
MRAKALPALVLCVAALATGQGAGADQLKPFEASYGWFWHGMNVAVSTLKLEQQARAPDAPAGDTWVYASKSEPRGFGRMFSERPTQQSIMRVTPSEVRPLHYKADDGTSSAKRDADLQFDWEHNRVTGTYEGATVDMPLQPGTQDDLSVQIALMVELLAGRAPAQFLMVDKNSVREYQYTREGEESLSTPLGKLDTVIYRSQKKGSPRVTRFWCAPSRGYIPLRVEQKKGDEVQWTMQVQSAKRE